MQLLSPHTQAEAHPQTTNPQDAYGHHCLQEQGGEARTRPAFIGKELACGLKGSPVDRGATSEPKALGFLF